MFTFDFYCFLQDPTIYDQSGTSAFHKAAANGNLLILQVSIQEYAFNKLINYYIRSAEMCLLIFHVSNTGGCSPVECR